MKLRELRIGKGLIQNECVKFLGIPYRLSNYLRNVLAQ